MIWMTYGIRFQIRNGKRLENIFRRETMLHFKATKNKPFTWVWRVEDEYGAGPYSQKDDIRVKWMRGEPHSSNNGHPSPFCDFGAHEYNRVKLNTGCRNSSCRFGFISLKQYYKWFSKAERKRLAQIGFKLRRRRASVVYRSDYQCMFMPFSSKIKSGP